MQKRHGMMECTSDEIALLGQYPQSIHLCSKKRHGATGDIGGVHGEMEQMPARFRFLGDIW